MAQIHVPSTPQQTAAAADKLVRQLAAATCKGTSLSGRLHKSSQERDSHKGCPAKLILSVWWMMEPRVILPPVRLLWAPTRQGSFSERPVGKRRRHEAGRKRWSSVVTGLSVYVIDMTCHVWPAGSTRCGLSVVPCYIFKQSEV